MDNIFIAKKENSFVFVSLMDKKHKLTQQLWEMKMDYQDLLVKKNELEKKLNSGEKEKVKIIKTILKMVDKGDSLISCEESDMEINQEDIEITFVNKTKEIREKITKLNYRAEEIEKDLETIPDELLDIDRKINMCILKLAGKKLERIQVNKEINLVCIERTKILKMEKKYKKSKPKISIIL